ncbi:MAG: two-component regulator propeller domain-containing protein [Bacteroidia bacterium]|nr:two-component regulator propeller domain-containing protein [Bacteroidia bacterium]
MHRGFVQLLAAQVGFVACAVGATAQGLDLAQAHRYTAADGLASDYANCLLADREGYLWVGTDRGISRFDGSQFVSFTADEGLPSNLVYTLYQDRRGEVWAGSFGGALARRQGSGFRAELGAPKSVTSLAEDATGVLYVATFTGVYARLATGQYRPVVESASGGPFAVVGVGQWGVVVAAPWGLLRCYSLPDGRVQQVPLRLPAVVTTPLGLGGVLRLSAWGADGFWLSQKGFTYGLQLAGNGLVVAANYPVQTEAVLEAQGAYHMATRTRGLVQYRGGVATRYGMGQGLPVDYLTHLATDYEGGLWVASFGGGILRLPRPGVQQLAFPNATGAAKVSALYHDNEGTTWVGTHTGYTLFEGANYRGEDPYPADAYFTARAVAQSPGGAYWLGTFTDLRWAATPAHARRGAWQVVAQLPDGVSALVPDGDSAVWVGTYGKGLLRYSRHPTRGWSRSQWYDTTRGLRSAMIEALVPSPTGLWVVHDVGGAAHLQGGRLTYYDRAAGLPSTTVTSVYLADDGSTWLGTARGLVRLIGGRLVRPAPTDPLYQAPIRAIFPAATGALWVLADRYRYQLTASGTGPFTAQRVGTWQTQRGGQGTLRRVLVVPQSQRLYLGTDQGVWVHDLRTWGQPTEPPRVQLEALVVDDDTVAVGELPPNLPATARRLVFAVGGQSFLGTLPLRYSYQLVGLDSAYSEPTEARTVVYTNLPHGTYTFRARALNADGVWSAAPVVVRFRLPPPLHRQTWFQALVALVVLGGVGGYVRYRVRRKLLRRIRALELQQQVDFERQRIARDLHDNVGAQLSGILSGLSVSERLLETQAAQRARLPQLLVDLQADTRATLGLLRDTVWALSHTALSLESLMTQVDSYARRQLAYHEGVRYEGQLDADPALTLAPGRALNVFRCVQEALSNSLKHGAPTRIGCRLHQPDPQTLHLRVWDDGRGMATAGLPEGSPSGHYGLDNLQKRARELGGTLRLHTAPGAGFAVELSFPLTGPSQTTP